MKKVINTKISKFQASLIAWNWWSINYSHFRGSNKRRSINWSVLEIKAPKMNRIQNWLLHSISWIMWEIWEQEWTKMPKNLWWNIFCFARWHSQFLYNLGGGSQHTDTTTPITWTKLVFLQHHSSKQLTKIYKGHKNPEDRVSMMLCSNMIGCYKTRTMIIGKSSKPRCFPSNAN